MVSPGPSVRRIRGKHKGKRKFHTPQDIREGVTNAYYILKEVNSALKIAVLHQLLSNNNICL